MDRVSAVHRGVWHLGAVAVACVGGIVHVARAQDSVSNTPGVSDALSAYGAQRTRYVVDLVTTNSSWGGSYVVGPLIKSHTMPGGASNQRLGAAALSADHLIAQSFPSLSFAEWTGSGLGVHPTLNNAPGSVSVSSFDRQFAAALSDFSSGATNIVSCRVGQQSGNWQRLFVDRQMAVCSRLDAVSADSATLSLGAVDAAGDVAFRADGFNTTAAAPVAHNNIGVVSFASRNSAVNHLQDNTGVTIASDASATSFSLNANPTTIACPTLAPGSLIGGAPQAISLSLLQEARLGSSLLAGHLDPAIAAHRGNPSFNQVTALGGVGAIATLAKTTSIGGRTQSINVFAIDATGAIIATDSTTMSGPITTPAGTFNAAGDAEFLHYLSQTIFRGPSGQVGLGFCPVANAPVVAATATDPTVGEFIAVATLTATPTWSVAAYEGKPVLDGLNGAPVGSLIAASPASMSSPAVDLLGNVYFVGAWQPVLGAPAKGLFKAVRTSPGLYQLEMILAEGQAMVGTNSTRTYTITDVTLTDANGVASGGFHQGQLLSRRPVGHQATDPANPRAFGGALVNATIRYNNMGQAETYQAALFVGPFLVQGVCPGDTNADGVTDLLDLQAVLFNFGLSSGATLPQGDVTGDGMVDLTDLQTVLFDFACGV